MPSFESNDYPRAALRVNEACATLGISRSQFYVEVAAKRLRVLKCGRRSLVAASEIQAWLERLPEKAA
jgi:excisionase family DNA binding protein